MAGVTHGEPAIAGEAAAAPTAARSGDSARTSGVALLRERRHEEGKLDRTLAESFPCSDPPATWAGP